MYVVGFCESFLGLLTDNEIMIIDGDIQDIRIIGIIVVTILLGIALIGMEWENKAQIFLLIILLAAMLNFFIGTFFTPDNEQKAQGFFGFKVDLFTENFGSNYKGHNFISVFSIIFPAATGIYNFVRFQYKGINFFSNSNRRHLSWSKHKWRSEKTLGGYSKRNFFSHTSNNFIIHSFYDTLWIYNA